MVALHTMPLVRHVLFSGQSFFFRQLQMSGLAFLPLSRILVYGRHIAHAAVTDLGIIFVKELVEDMPSGKVFGNQT